MAEFTPMMQHYLQTKEEYKDCILFYRLGDFYEMFFDDAVLVSKELELTLTGKSCGMEERAPMCGIPYHAVEGYLNRLVANGHKVAICEQVEDPKLAKGIVKIEELRVPVQTEEFPDLNVSKKTTKRRKSVIKLEITLLPAADPILRSLSMAENDYEQARDAGLSEEEIVQYAYLSAKIKENVQKILV